MRTQARYLKENARLPVEKLEEFFDKLSPGRKRLAGTILVVSIHGLLLWALITGLALHTIPAENRELHLVLVRFPAERAPTAPAVVIPEIALASPPEIDIAPDAVSSAPTTAAVSLVLAPRPDPSHPNPSPPATGRDDTFVIAMKILIMPNGEVGDASVLTSSGNASVDAKAISFVKLNWRFLPALLNGTAIQYWTTAAISVTS